jgi:hypothetical protein
MDPVEQPSEDRTGVCCSGGGIRSAAFNLGALQALDRHGALRGADYLTAVSGGSYIASAYAMVAKRWRGERRPPKPKKDGDYNGYDDSDPDLFTPGKTPFYRGSPEEQYLRNRSSYLAPGGMGKLYLGFRVVLGLLFNLFFVGIFLFGVGVLLAAWMYRPYVSGLAGGCDKGEACDPAAVIPQTGWIPPTILAGIGVVLGLAGLVVRLDGDKWRSALETWAARFLIAAGVVGFLLVALPLLVDLLLSSIEAADDPGEPRARVGVAATASLASVVAGVLLQLRARVSEPARVLEDVRGAAKVFRKLGTGARKAFVYLAGAVAGPLLLLMLLVATIALVLSHSSPKSVNVGWVAVGIGALAVFGVLYRYADLTSWSLHPFYRRRLCTAFALKRVKPVDAGPNRPSAKRPDEERDGVAVERDFGQLVPLSETGMASDAEGDWPTLIVCAAANVSDPGATPPGRAVSSFTFSAESMGGPLIGGISTKAFENSISESRRRDFTLPAAVAMSGAALSPSMGKLTRRPLTFLLALANVRLGVWVPNPRRTEDWRKKEVARRARFACRHPIRRMRGERSALPEATPRKRFIPRPRPSYLVRELVGYNHVNAKFLYVSDGGHYENLGLVELLRRGCANVYCFDASGGDSFTELGDAIALARSELGVEIDIDPRPLVPKGERQLADTDVVVGTITFPHGGPSGRLVYARTVMTARAPWDVHAYHGADRTFPHNATADQLYTDQKFEAYRTLGECAGTRAVTVMGRPHRADSRPAQLSDQFVPAPAD